MGLTVAMGFKISQNMVYAASGVPLLYSDMTVKHCGSSRMTSGPEINESWVCAMDVD